MLTLKKFALLVGLVITTSNFSFAAEKNTVLFEGYSKIINAGVHTGYTVMRYEYNPNTKRFVAISFLRTGQLGSDVMESLKAEADEKFGPISYQYTAVVGKETKTIDAKFNRKVTKVKGSKEPKIQIQMVADIKDGKVKKTIKKDLEDGVFLSSFLVYVMLQTKTGIQTNSNYQYKAIAEEDASVESGHARVDKQEKYSGFDAYKVTNTFKGVTFTSYVTDKGEVLATKSPSISIATELVPKSSEAIGSYSLNSGILKTLFGEVPDGTDNIVSKRATNEEKPIVIPANPKQDGVPPGQGIVIKPDGQKKEDSKEH